MGGISVSDNAVVKVGELALTAHVSELPRPLLKYAWQALSKHPN